MSELSHTITRVRDRKRSLFFKTAKPSEMRIYQEKGGQADFSFLIYNARFSAELFQVTLYKMNASECERSATMLRGHQACQQMLT